MRGGIKGYYIRGSFTTTPISQQLIKRDRKVIKKKLDGLKE